MSPMDLGLKDQVYVVTGASAGLGFATAQVLVEEGARVVVCSRSADRVDAAVSLLGGTSSAIGLAILVRTPYPADQRPAE